MENKILFTYKNNHYLYNIEKDYFCIRSCANVDGSGYSYFNVTDANMIEILMFHLGNEGLL